jgi:hypothetical protein
VNLFPALLEPSDAASVLLASKEIEEEDVTCVRVAAPKKAVVSC